MAEKKRKEDKKRLTATQVILIVGFICVIATVVIVGAYIYKSMQKQQEPPEEPSTGNLVVDTSNLENIMDDMQNRVDDSMFEISMNMVWSFPDGGSASSDAYLANVHGNHYAISFEVLLDGTETIFTSDVIPVGSRIKEIKLDRDLPAGEYEAVCQYHLLKEDGTENSSFRVNIILSVKE